VLTGRAILAACPALRTLTCRLVAHEDPEQDGAALAALCVFLRHPAVRCETLFTGPHADAEDSDAVCDALGDALRAQAPYLIRLGVGFAHPWLVARLAAVLPALRSLQSIYFMDGLPAAAAAALGAVPALARLHADVERFEDGSLAALARALAAPGSAVRNLVLVPCRRNMPPPYNPPPDADVARLAAAVMDPCVPTATTAAFHSSPCTSRRIGTTAQACACRCSPAASPP
jgi:hypothetical protein